eukprot:2062289-Pleurochrysis_carterae.AAC.1
MIQYQPGSRDRHVSRPHASFLMRSLSLYFARALSISHFLSGTLLRALRPTCVFCLALAPLAVQTATNAVLSINEAPVGDWGGEEQDQWRRSDVMFTSGRRCARTAHVGPSDSAVGHPPEPQILEHAIHDCGLLGSVKPLNPQVGGVHEHLPNGQILEECIRLHHVAGGALEELAPGLAVEQDRAGGVTRVLPVGQHVEQRALPAARRAHDGTEPAGSKHARTPLQNALHVPVGGVVALGDAARFQLLHGNLACRRVELDRVEHLAVHRSSGRGRQVKSGRACVGGRGVG